MVKTPRGYSWRIMPAGAWPSTSRAAWVRLHPQTGVLHLGCIILHIRCHWMLVTRTGSPKYATRLDTRTNIGYSRDMHNSTSTDGAGLKVHALDGAGGSTKGPPNVQVWCTYCAGFEPIRDLPSLSSLPPPLSFPGAHPPHSPSHSSFGTLVESTASMVIPTSPKMQHSPSQGDSSAYSSGPSTRGGRHSTTHSEAGIHASSASSSSYASYNNSYASSNTSTSKKEWWPLGNTGTMGWSSGSGTSPHPAPRSFLSDPYPHAHALHVRFLCWFLDAGGAVRPNAPAGVLRMLVEAFSACGLGVSVATDGTLYQTEVFTASHSPAFTPSSPSVTSVSSHGHSSSSHGSSSKKGKESKKWGDRPVLYETIKLLYTFPQSVGIGGGHPSSSYYFGVQGDGLFYLLTLTTLAPQSLFVCSPPSQRLEYRGRPLPHHTGTTRTPRHSRTSDPRCPPRPHTLAADDA
ncbi:hypothetical protein B0H13DRAFT_2415528 [Mycena leptocephala]|nr:hypothetical protein B0H13DRAFT_2415528 [Mycena leptocephala]